MMPGADKIDLVVSERARIPETLILRGCGRVEVAEFARIEDHVLIDLGYGGTGTVTLGARAKLKYGAVLRCFNGRIRIGNRTTVGEYTVVGGHGGFVIGDDVGIAAHCTLWASDHIMDDPEVPIRYQGETALGLLIEDAVWIGAGVTVLDGVCVGQGAAIGAGAVVTRALPSRHLCMGVPCRPVRKIEPKWAHERGEEWQ